MDVRDALTRWMTVVALTLIGAAAAAAVLAFLPARYEASAEVFVSLDRSDNAGELAQGDVFVQTRIRSFVQMVDSPVVLDPVIEQLRLSESADALAERVDAESTLDTNLLTVTATDDSPVRAAELANATVDSLGDIANAVQPALPPGNVPLRLVTIRPAAAPANPSVATLPALAAGAFAGFAVGVVVVVLRDRLRGGNGGGRRRLSRHREQDR